MKTYRQLREKWIRSGKTIVFNKGKKIDIFINPTMRELKTINDTGMRGFIAPNGKVYIASNGIHEDIANIIKDEVTVSNSIPIIIEDISKMYSDATHIRIGDYNNKWSNKQKQAKDIILKNTWIKKMFNDVRVFNNYNHPIKEDWVGKFGTNMNQKLFDLYKNPSPKELKEMGNPIRFVFFPDNSLYAWNGFKALHDDVIFEVKRKHNTMKHMIAGTLVIKGRDVYVVQSAWDMKQSQFKKQSGNSSYNVDELKDVFDKSVYFRRHFGVVHVE